MLRAQILVFGFLKDETGKEWNSFLIFTLTLQNQMWLRKKNSRQSCKVKEPWRGAVIFCHQLLIDNPQSVLGVSVSQLIIISIIVKSDK